MRPSWAHSTPKGRPGIGPPISSAGPPATGTRHTFSSAKNPMYLPFGEKNGARTSLKPSASRIDCSSFKRRTHRFCFHSNARSVPSGEMAISRFVGLVKSTRSPTSDPAVTAPLDAAPPCAAAPKGSAMEKRTTGAAVVASGCRSHDVAAKVAAATIATSAHARGWRQVGDGTAGAATSAGPPATALSSAMRASPMCCSRVFGLRSRQRARSCLRITGVVAGSAEKSTSLLYTATSRSGTSSPSSLDPARDDPEALEGSNARRPASISYSTAPKAQMSAR